MTKLKIVAILAEKRLAMAEQNKNIQGYSEGVFWERNRSQNRRRSPRGEIAQRKISHGK